MFSAVLCCAGLTAFDFGVDVSTSGQSTSGIQWMALSICRCLGLPILQIYPKNVSFDSNVDAIFLNDRKSRRNYENMTWIKFLRKRS